MNWGRAFLWGIPLLILGTQAPIFLQMTLTPDAVLFDIQTRCLLDGGVLYRNVVEPNLPGVVWIHALVRSVAGWSPMVLRSFDLAVVIADPTDQYKSHLKSYLTRQLQNQSTYTSTGTTQYSRIFKEK